MNNKKILYIAIAAIVVIAAVVLSVVFLGGNNTNNGTNNNGGNQTVEPAYKNAVELLTLVWDKVPFLIDDAGTPDNTEDDLTKYVEYEGEKYHNFMGGFELDAEEIPVMVQGAPGNFMLNGEMIDSMLGYPAAKLSSIDSVASLMFDKNQNMFTCGAYHVVDGTNVTELANAIEENIQNRQWWCGFPERVIIIQLPGNYLISIFGQSLATTFADIVVSSVEGAQILVNNPIR
jgi:hypothetical protein